MKGTLTVFFLTVFSVGIFAQNFSGRAVYHSHSKSSIKISGVGEAEKKKMEEQFKKLSHKVFILDFNGKESIFKKEAKLEAPDSKSRVTIVSNDDIGDILYKNIAERRFVDQRNFMGKQFLVKDDLDNENWELSEETKKIGVYNCYKAIKNKVVDYRKYDNATETFKDTTRTISTVAWYTPDIPVSNGPDKHWGLPGLILEVKQGNKTIVCSEVTLEKDKVLEIEPPRRGKKVSQKKFDDIRDKKAEEMMKRYKNNRKKGDKNSISITITK